MLGDVDGALNHLTLMLIRHYSGRQVFSGEAVVKAEQLGEQLAGQMHAKEVFSSLFELFVSCRQL